MQLEDIVGYWSRLVLTADGHWVHSDDREILRSRSHSFNLDFPACAYVGNVLEAPVVILGANLGYHPERTTQEFERGEPDVQRYLKRIAEPDKVDWKGAGGVYYGRVKYGKLLFDGRAVMVDACGYRSPSISSEPENQALLAYLPSVKFMRLWLLEALLPLAQSGRRLVVAKRWGLWNASKELRAAQGVVMDRCPQNKNITGRAKECVSQWLEDNGFGVWNP